jgi:Rrf2 family protein
LKLITRDTDYAIRALCHIAKQKEKVVSVTELVKKLRVPRPFLRKILQILNSKGILKSLKGQGGGFKLLRPPEKIFVVDLIRVFQGSFSLNECFLKKMVCPHKKTCQLKKRIDDIEKDVLSKLSTISIAAIIKGE